MVRDSSRPQVSILMTVRDAEATLEASLQSLGRQSLEGYEAVIVDDGSVDRSGEMLDELAARDARFRVVHLSPSGLVAALNAGLALCRATLVARMDADDLCHPRRLELQRELLLARPGIGVVSCAVRHFPRQHVQQGLRHYEAWLNSLDTHSKMAVQRFVEAPVAHPSVMIRRRLLDEAGGYRDCGWPEDHDLWLRLFARGVRFAKLPRILFFWRDHAQRLSRTHGRYTREAFRRCKLHHLLRGPLAESGQLVLWGAGPTGRRWHKLLGECGRSVQAVVDIDPEKQGTKLRGSPVVAPAALPALLSDEVVVLVVVAARGARDLIRPRLEALGLAEGEGFWCLE